MGKRRRQGQRGQAKGATASAVATSPREYSWWSAIILVAITVAAFASVRHFEFVRYDDLDYVVENAHVKAGLTWDGLKWALTTGFIANWHPLTWLSHMLDVQLFGVSAGAHHLVNLFLHVINTLLLFVVLRRMTGRTVRSAFVAALFAIHPLHVESVAWVSERKDMLSTLCWMLTLLAYVSYVQQPAARRYVTVLVCFTLGLLAKPMVVTLPFVLLLLDVWPLQRISLWRDGERPIAVGAGSTMMRLVGEKVPLFALAVTSSIVTVIVQRSWGAVGSTTAYPIELRLANAVVNYVAYIQKMVWPARLAAFYPYRQSVSPWTVVAAALLLVGVTVGVVRGARRRPYLLVGWFWFLGTLLPVIGIIQAGIQSIADRYTYIPLIGLFIIVVWSAAELAEKGTLQRAVVLSVAAVVLVACLLKARAQSETWRDTLALWQNAIEATSDNAYAHYSLGAVLVHEGRVDEGIARFRDALRIDPDYADVHIDLGNALNARGAADEALAEFATVVRLRPDYPEARVVYGNMLRARGRNADAIAQYRVAARLNPSMASAHNELGNALTSEGQFADAMTEYAQAVRLDPTFAEAHNNLGAALSRQDKSDEAIAEFREAIRLKPQDATFHYNAALTLERMGRASEAIEHLQASLRMNPGLGPARRALDRLASKPRGE